MIPCNVDYKVKGLPHFISAKRALKNSLHLSPMISSASQLPWCLWFLSFQFSIAQPVPNHHRLYHWSPTTQQPSIPRPGHKQQPRRIATAQFPLYFGAASINKLAWVGCFSGTPPGPCATHTHEPPPTTFCHLRRAPLSLHWPHINSMDISRDV